jgi:hypothetical protein
MGSCVRPARAHTAVATSSPQSRGVEPQRFWGHELHREAAELAPHVLVHDGRVPHVARAALAAGRRLAQPLGVHVRARVPELVALGAAAVPSEPPVHHGGRHIRHGRAQRHAHPATGLERVAVSDHERAQRAPMHHLLGRGQQLGGQRPVRQRVARLARERRHHGPVVHGERARAKQLRRPAQLAPRDGSCGHHGRPIHGWKRPGASRSARTASSFARFASATKRAGRWARFSSAS